MKPSLHRVEMPRINPFEPNSPVNPGSFVGRLEEIRRLERCLIQTSAGRPVNFMITGERGIGKTSLLNYLKHTAEGRIRAGDTTVSFLVIDTDVDQETSQQGLVQKIELGIKRKLSKSEAARKWIAEVWKFAQRLEVSGVRLRAEEAQHEELLLEEFSYSLADLVDRTCGDESQSLFGARYDGVLILIDEADRGSNQLRLGSFFKLLAERLQRRSCNRVVFGLAGLSELRTSLLEDHPSSLRLFDELVLARLSDSEVDRVIDICLSEAERLNGIATRITPDGREALRSLSEGYPHFIQQFGFSSFDVDTDDEISRDDVGNGAFGPRGAMEAIGDRYYRDAFYRRIQKESYRQVLRIMADRLDDWVTKKEIRARFRGSGSTLDNAILALRNRKIIFSKEGEQGVYRLQHKGFALWIRLFTTDPGQLAQRVLNGSPPAQSGGGGPQPAS